MQNTTTWTECAENIMREIHQLAQYSENKEGLTRTYLSSAHQLAATQIAQSMCAAGMNVRRDMTGNVIGRYEALTENAPAILTGSHFDTVNNAGKFDGILGVVLPIACIAKWNARQIRFPYAIEVIAFSEEEGVRFGATLLGSRALAGTFDMQVLENKDQQGISLQEAMRMAGFHAEGIIKAAYPKQQALAFLEVHIEQGPVLLENGLALGVVSAISGASRYTVEIHGQTGHAGTTPMTLRRDAATAAAEIMLYIEQRCQNTAGLVGTVGQFQIPNGAANVIPGFVQISIDIRAGQDALRLQACTDILNQIELIGARRQVEIKLHKTHDANSVPCATRLQDKLKLAIQHCDLPARILPSGAGHDAMAMAAVTDVAMLFVRCGNGGISHHPDEIMDLSDAALAARAFSYFIEHFEEQL